MPIEKPEVSGAQYKQEQRCRSFATQAADRIRADGRCLFSMLPSDELARLAAGWYEACAQAMQRGNYAPIDKWIRSQSAIAAAEGFTQDDVLHLLRLCQSTAFETEHWNENVFSQVAQVIKEAVWDTSGWQAPSEVDYVAEPPDGSDPSLIDSNAGEHASERRTFVRNSVQVPIRIRSIGGPWQGDEVTATRSISRGGLYFFTQRNYFLDQTVVVTYPYRTHPGAITRDYSGKVVRIDRLYDRNWGVAIHFLESLGQSSR
jgi:hypothetical protein